LLRREPMRSVRIIRWLSMLCLLAGLAWSGIAVAQSPAPAITSVDPASGLNTAATNIVIKGSGFFGTPSVALGTNVLADVSLLDSTQILAVVPPGLPPATYDLIITNPDSQVAILPAGFAVRTPTPQVLSLRPDRGRTDLPNDINLYGFNFAVGVSIRLADSPNPDVTDLTTTRINATHLRAVVPAGLTPGVYDVTVRNIDDSSHTLPDAYTVFEVTNDDLYGYGYELWTDPTTVRQGDTARVALTVHRQGGKKVLQNVKVRFTLGDAAPGGTALGDGTILLLSPRSSDNTSPVDWTPAAPGSYILYGVIDPDNEVAEALETNNVVSRTVTVLGPAADQIAPHVDQFDFGGNENTTDPLIRLSTAASDPAPGSGVASLLFQEYEYSQGAGQWVPAQNSGWLAYEANRTNYPWTLLPTAGVKYLQAWASDGEGNVSILPFKGFVSYIPPSDSVGLDQGRVYRFSVQSGQQISAQVTPISGDPDLYVWPPDAETRPPKVSNLSGSAAESVVWEAPVSGVYQVEVYGYSAAQYQLAVEVTAANRRSLGAGSGWTAGVEETKPERSTPTLSVSSVPGAQLALPTAPLAPSTPTEKTEKLYLPMTVR
ncbi:MAG: IPT/TIG domain-containing protein, partial [Caldilineaceae bacterium]